MTSRRRLLAGSGLAALVVAGGVLLVLDDGGGDDTGAGISGDLPAAPVVPDAVGARLSAEAEEVLALLEEGDAGRYHATYAVDADPATTGGAVTLEVWRNGDRSRRDTRTLADDGVAETAGIVDGDAVVSCQRVTGSEWTCERLDGEGGGTGVEAELLGSVRAELAGAEVDAGDEEIDGRPVRCFRFDTVDGRAELCATTEGIVVRLGVGDTVLRLTALDADVPAAVFDPPAEPRSP